MKREDALIIARRQMDRIESDGGVVHLDTLTDEIVAGLAIVEQPQRSRSFTIEPNGNGPSGVQINEDGSVTIFNWCVDAKGGPPASENEMIGAIADFLRGKLVPRKEPDSVTDKLWDYYNSDAFIELYRNALRDLFPPAPEPEPEPPLAIPGIKISGNEVIGRWTSGQMVKAGYRYHILSDEWVS